MARSISKESNRNLSVMTSDFMIEGQIAKRRIFVKYRVRRAKAHKKVRLERMNIYIFGRKYILLILLLLLLLHLKVPFSSRRARKASVFFSLKE